VLLATRLRAKSLVELYGCAEPFGPAHAPAAFARPRRAEQKASPTSASVHPEDLPQVEQRRMEPNCQVKAFLRRSRHADEGREAGVIGGSLMSILAWIVLGLIAGFIASKLVNRTGGSLVLDLLLGVVGAFVGGFLFTRFGAAGVTGLNLYSILVAIIGAVIVLFIYHAIAGRRTM
jgi:uncharacterized membrane protein YeaQ/YmgE (transglycosylase-associated protein family)